MDSDSTQTSFDVIIIGSGFGGAMAAYPLVHAGLKVLMLERGNWVPRGPFNWEPNGSLELSEFNTKETQYRLHGSGHDYLGITSCVGGQSVFYGGVSLRFRERDFEHDPSIMTDSAADWPYTYSDIESYYSEAEQILGVSGKLGDDPTEPYHSSDYPQRAAELAPISQKIAGVAEKLHLHPFHLPLAVNRTANAQQPACILCTTFDTYPCAIGAKNDLAMHVFPLLLEKGLQLKVNTVSTRLIAEGNRIAAVECYDKISHAKCRYTAHRVVLSAGALASPHLLLSSNLERLNPGGYTIGHYLMRHCAAIVFGFFRQSRGMSDRFHKELGINDYYFGHPTIKYPQGKLGNIQQEQTPPIGLVEKHLPTLISHLIAPLSKHLTGLIALAEDQPRYDNHVSLDWKTLDPFGLPELRIHFQPSKRDLAARNALVKKAKEILKNTGSLFHYVHKINTFTHAVGTVRMGSNEDTSALDQFCKFRGVNNLYVVDGSFMPTCAGVNPSLTIAANALRVGKEIIRTLAIFTIVWSHLYFSDYIVTTLDILDWIP